MIVRPQYFFRIVQLIDHRFPLFITIIFNHDFLFFFVMQPDQHTRRVGFGMKLCTDKIFRKADSHDCPFVRNMWPLFFNAKNVCAQFLQPCVIGLYQLIIAAVNCVKWIRHSFKNRLSFPGFQKVNRKNTKSSRLPFGKLAHSKMPAGQLVGMTDKKDVFFLFFIKKL